MVITRSAEDYLEAILILKEKKGMVRSIDVAHHLEYSKPSVSRAVTNLKREGYLIMQPGGELVLTQEGLKIAENIYERHTILTNLLLSIGVSLEAAAEDACRMEHVISEETFERLKALYKKRQQETEKPAVKKSDAGGDGKKKKKKKKKGS